ncbi:type IV secretory system conjugative DNA transfer family protein [Kordiimonas sp. SCSIO 12603]|uniref:type IV secretory system conjugative DNA transfer family protein n=1 Tax=Kordiimonas sp. SCSIO 12603 TaxID=2829596 RepID=UPI002103B487|nr:type IV secretory system conjugative DNA transfer family protein [Kordiimonas sp. SCSIO 12603]UTW59525.1 type IV secretory system conjugative DNA transfer family protein [Kordiimonas sp. SCSIO 12603]
MKWFMVLLPIGMLIAAVESLPAFNLQTWEMIFWYSVTFIFGVLLSATAYEGMRFFEKVRNGNLATARFGKRSELAQGGLNFKEGLIVAKDGNKPLRFNKAGHLITVSKTRGGKGVSSVIPNLLDHQGSVFCVDIKGENYAITAERRKELSTVFCLAPFEENSNCYNPLDFIRYGPDEIDDASLIASLIVVPGEVSMDSFWDKEARALLTGLILYVVRHKPKELQNLAEVRRLITLGEEDFDDLLEAMKQSPHPWIKRAASAFGQKAEKERSGVISTAQSHTKVFDSPRLTSITSSSDFKLEDLKQHVISLYLNIPPHQIAVYRPYLRLIVGLTQAAMTRNQHIPERPVLFLLDEFPALGKMPVNGFAYLAGYGVSLWVFTQSIGQLEAIYGKQADAILSNCAITQVWSLAPADFKTAEHVSRTLGEKMVTTYSETRSQRRRLSLAHNYTDNRSTRTRRLLTPDEILCLPEGKTLLFVSGLRPFLVNRVIYYKDSFFRGLYGKWGNRYGKTE